MVISWSGYSDGVFRAEMRESCMEYAVNVDASGGRLKNITNEECILFPVKSLLLSCYPVILSVPVLPCIRSCPVLVRPVFVAVLKN